MTHLINNSCDRPPLKNKYETMLGWAQCNAEKTIFEKPHPSPGGGGGGLAPPKTCQTTGG